MDEEPMQAAAAPALPQPADTLLPHRPPMRVVEALAKRQGTRAVALATLPSSGVFAMAGRILPEYFIELIAQTAALGNGYDALMNKMTPLDGMLAGVDSFSWRRQPQQGASVSIETDIPFAFGAMKVVHGEVYAGGGQLLAQGDLKVWEDLAGEAKKPSPVPAVSDHRGDGSSRETGSLPAGTDGRSLYQALSGCCFEPRVAGRTAVRLEASGEFRFPPDFPGFQGHFPNNPILPAIAQLAAVRYLAEWSLGFPAQPELYQKAKFKGAIRPGEPVKVGIILHQEGEKWGGTYSLKRPNGEAVAGGLVGFVALSGLTPAPPAGANGFRAEGDVP